MKSAPERRWQALARQSVFGASWLAIRGDAGAGCAHPRDGTDLVRVYDDLHSVIEGARGRTTGASATSSGRAP